MTSPFQEHTAAPRSQAYGVFLIVLGAVFIGFMPTSAKIAYADGANALGVLLLRSAFGALGLAIYLLMRGQPVVIERKYQASAMTSGVMHMAAAVGILGSIAYIDVSLASVVLFLFPFIVAIVNHRRGVSRLTARVVMLMVLATLGLGLALGVSLDSLHPMGLGLAGFGAIAIAVMILNVSDISARVGALQANLYMVIWAMVLFAIVAVVLPMTGLFDPMASPRTLMGWIATAVAGLSFTFGYVAFFAGAAVIGTTRASVLSILEPVFIITIAVAILGERLTPVQWAGMLMVMGSLLAMEMFRTRTSQNCSEDKQ